MTALFVCLVSVSLKEANRQLRIRIESIMDRSGTGIVGILAGLLLGGYCLAILRSVPLTSCAGSCLVNFDVIYPVQRGQVERFNDLRHYDAFAGKAEPCRILPFVWPRNLPLGVPP